MQFHVIRRAEDLSRRTFYLRSNDAGALFQARSQHGVLQISPRFSEVGDCVVSCRVAAPQPLDLREHEPHPVGAFLSGVEFR